MKAFSDRAAKFTKRLSLHPVLVVPFVLQISLAVGLTGWLSVRNGQQAVNDVASQLRGEITARIEQYLETYVTTPHQINRVNADAIRLNELNLQDFSQLERHFLNQIQIFESVRAIYVGTEQDGSHIGAERGDDGTLQVKVSGDETGHEVRFYAVDRNLNRTKLLKAKPNFNARIRPWYKTAVQKGKANWGEIYKLFAAPNYVLNASLPIYDDRQTLVGVAAVDFSLERISKFLKSMKIGRSGETFIIERQTGLLVANSANQQPYVVENPTAPKISQKSNRVKAIDSSDPRTRLTTQHLLQRFGGLTQIVDRQQLDFEANGQRQFLQVAPLRTEQGLDWLIVVVVPEADFMDQIQANTRTTILLCIAAFGLATLLGIFTARWITKPILRLGSAAKAISQGNLDQTVSINSTTELNQLGQSFNQMAAQLRESFSKLERTNEELEERVAQRTTELGIKNAQLERAKEAADAANLAKSQFLSNMSHELRTPLNVILGFTQLLARHQAISPSSETGLSPRQQQYLNTINRSGEDLLALINDVLEMSKIEAGRITLNESTVDLFSLLDRSEQMFQLKAQLKGLRLTLERSNKVPRYIHTDESKLRQVLLNLIGNAIKFTQSGGVILRVSTANDADLRLIFSVEDTGPGISPSDRDRLFKPFVQTEAGLKSQQGTGLGLPISQKFVQMMGGELTVKSEFGKGSVFTFDIQTRAVKPETVPMQLPPREVIGLEPGQRTYRILVAEDKAENRQFLLELLTPIGFDVRSTNDGQAAIDLLKSWMPDLIWMDMRMPVLNGYEATRQIKAAYHPAPIVIALTGSAFEEDRVTALSAGCDDFVRKPVRADVIFDKMAEYLGVRYCYAAKPSNQAEMVLSSVEKRTADLNVSELSEMSIDWITELHEAATRVNAKQVLDLIQQIPDSYASLSETLCNLVNNYCFEEIVRVTQPDPRENQEISSI
ncbi:hybrid sensor histidine kinase/response regulator [Leptolyngbya sp. NIES-2104]|uniref:hybrid sensor histidine kinase/response regulator n=1 Tax=Leptolyngbya sp. NIES-2104 TaxID=1552121 RepID=UPI0006ECC23A|nr:hybrid sensor histidine kinase/response regulator [Leptolyngbya sp. NIES-2104]GAP94218.1 circadian input kinase A [Leptolyngbya sp. NIES-2104]